MKLFKKIGETIVGFILLLVLVLIISGIISAYGNYKEKKKLAASDKAMLEMGIPFPTEKELDAEMKKTPSDLKGMTQYDKVKSGLEWEDGSDSDADGLTDQEEIEVYHTDPLKMSTAGDLYTDKYKIEHNMDTSKKYKYEETISFEYNECEEVKLSAHLPSDLYAVVKDDTANYSLEEFGIKPIYKVYSIYNYNGKITVNLTETFSKNEIDYSDINIYIAKGQYLIPEETELEKVEYKEDGNVVSIEYAFETRQEYKLFIAGKKSLINSIGLKFSEKENPDASIDMGLEKGTGLIWSFSVIENFFHRGSFAEYEDMGDDKKTTVVRDGLFKVGNNEIAGGAFSVDGANTSKKSGFLIELKYKILKTLLPHFEYTTKKSLNFRHAFFGYYHHTEELTYSQDKTKSSFDIAKDSLPFRNFASYIGKNGNCAGIAHFTSYLYNHGEAPTKGSYTVNKKQITWNLTKDKENHTLYDPGLSDYKSKEFVDSRATADTNFYIKAESSDEKNFINMIGCYWAEANDKSDLRTFMKTDGKKNDFSLIKKMIKQLDAGKVLDVHLLMRYGGGHAVNVYGYMKSKTDPDQYWFKVYDSNIPQNDRKDLNASGPYLSVHREIDEQGNEEFIYLYYPIKGNTDYISTSDQGLMPRNSLIVMDDMWNIYN